MLLENLWLVLLFLFHIWLFGVCSILFFLLNLSVCPHFLFLYPPYFDGNSCPFFSFVSNLILTLFYFYVILVMVHHI